MLGIIIGSILANRLDTEIHNNIYETTDSIIYSLAMNLKFILPIYLLGLVSFGIIFTPLILCWKGINIGLTVGFIVKFFGVRGFIFTILGLLPQYLMIIPAFLGIAGLSLANSSHISKSSRKSRDLYTNFGDYSILTMLFILLFILASIIEVYITPYFYKFVN